MRRIIATANGIIGLILYTLNILIGCILLFLISVLRLVPLKNAQQSWNYLIAWLAPCWVSINTQIQNLTIPKTKWIIRSQSGPLETILDRNHWYLLISNHQNWADILVLQRIFNHKIPFPKFFFKRALLWILPFASWACWLLHFPLVYRYTRAQLAKKPELKLRNLAITQQACEIFKQFPTTVANFVEGSRFSAKKHALQQSPYQYLLKPQAGGIALSIEILHQHLDKLLNVTICYNGARISFWNFLCGDIDSITVYVETLPITADLIGNYQHDRLFRMHIQKWLNQIWLQKDRLIQQHITSNPDNRANQ